MFEYYFKQNYFHNYLQYFLLGIFSAPEYSKQIAVINEKPLRARKTGTPSQPIRKSPIRLMTPRFP